MRNNSSNGYPHFIFASLLFFGMLLTGCSKKTEQNNFMRGSINGVSFECSSGFDATVGAAGNRQIFFKGNNAQYSFSFYLDGQSSDIVPGNYIFTSGILRSATVYEGSEGYGAGQFTCIPACALQGSGSINISGIDKKHVEGSFEFVTAVNPGTGLTKTVTGGSFYVKRN